MFLYGLKKPICVNVGNLYQNSTKQKIPSGTFQDGKGMYISYANENKDESERLHN